MKASGKIYPYIVVLQNTQKQKVRIMGLMMCLMGMLILTYRGLGPGGLRMNLLFAGTTCLLTIWNFIEMRKGGKIASKYALLVISAGLLLLPPFQGLGLLFLLMALIEKKALSQVEIGFADDHIRFNSFRKKDHAWAEMQQVILKDGILTLDFQDNRLLQLEVDDEDDEDYDADEDEFNAWCKERIVAEKRS